MLNIQDLKVALTEGNKEIIHGLNLTINPGEIHLLNGNNGSGKSTLVNTLMGNPMFSVTGGKVQIKNENYSEYILSKIDSELLEDNIFDLTEMDTDQRSLLGLFLANQYPVEIPGVALTNYLRLIYNSRLPKEEQISVFKFKKLLEEKANIINYPKHLLSRNLNEGFSGGEKKKTEILQMLVIEPKYVFLDEIDSGLDRNSVKEVFEGIATFKEMNPNCALVIITHYDRALEYLSPTFVHEMSGGNLIKSNT